MKTSKVLLGTDAMVVPYHYPVHIARKFLTLDHLSKGRAIFGAALGYRLPEFEDLYGNPYFHERGRQTDEALHIIKTLWTEGDIKFQGKYFHINELVNKMGKPYQKPHPPIMIGGGMHKGPTARQQWPGTKPPDLYAPLKRVVKYGDKWGPAGSSPDGITEGYDRIMELAKAAGRTMPERFITSTFIMSNISRNREESIKEFKKAYDRRVVTTHGVTLYRSQMSVTFDDVINKNEMISVMGSPEDCAKKIKAFANVPGLERLVFNFQSEDLIGQLEKFDKEVLPLLIHR
jgi:alkanesulfonate monooxygenase SsuD/methylene tetrahydromethanopterin reductase-like flavin-dependent oxidoreductase (luciferase family)